MWSRIVRRFRFKDVHRAVLGRPLRVLVCFGLLTVVLALAMPRLSVRTSIYDLIVEDLPAAAVYQNFKELFGSDEIIRVVVKAEDVFDPATFAFIDRLAVAAARIQGVSRVLSLPDVRRSVDAGGRWSLPEFAEILAPVALFERNLVSADRRASALTLVLDPKAPREDTIRSVAALIDAAPRDVSLYQVGMPLVAQALARYTLADLYRLPPLTIIIIALILWAIFRWLRYLFIPLGCVSLSVVWTFGLMAWTGTPLSMLTMIVPVFLIAVGTAYCLHILSGYRSACTRADSARAATLDTFEQLTFPTVLAIATTIIGIGSLLVNRIPSIQEFALFACFGMFSFLLMAVLLLPAWLCLLPLPAGAHKSPRDPGKWVSWVIERIIRLDLHHQRVVMPILALLVVFCALGILRLRVETNPIGYFRPSAPVRANFADIHQTLCGSFPLHVVMASTDEDYFEDPEHLAALARFQNYLEGLEGVDKTVSLADYMKLVNYALNRFDPAFYVLPRKGFEVRMVFNNFKNLLGENVLHRFVSPDLSATNILAFTHMSSSRNFLAARHAILEHTGSHFARDLTWTVTGFGVVISTSSQLITHGQVKSLGLTLALVFAIMFVLFLSAKVGFIAILTNLFPIVVNFGIMGWLGIELSMVTSLIASIAIGLAVDDTIHYLVRYNREFKKDLDKRRALQRTLEHVGRPIMFTTVTIAAGFSVLIFSSFTPTAIFGVMMVITMFSALVGDMILLPSLMLHVELVTLWDLIGLKMGKDPRQGIPLFHGLSRTQVHYIIMAGAIVPVTAGQCLFRRGDPSDCMYAVISGSLDVLDAQQDETDPAGGGVARRIARLKTGDVVGEMGLLREVPRSATVAAAEAGELLLINRKMIRRLQWLYPPTAQKFFFNLMTIICDRLECATRSLADESLIDEVTGLYNHKGFYNLLESEIHRSRRYGSELGLCLLTIGPTTPSTAPGDVDRELLLRAVVGSLSANIRRCDALARTDSMTFALLLPQTPAPRARIICRRLQRRLCREIAAVADSTPQVAIARVSLSKGEKTDAAELMARAREALRNPGSS